MVDAKATQIVAEIQDLMWQDVGIVRVEEGLRRVLNRLESLVPQLSNPSSRAGHEAQNIHAAGLLVARSALARKESRGAHYRTDFPAHDDATSLKHSVIQGDSIRFE